MPSVAKRIDATEGVRAFSQTAVIGGCRVAGVGTSTTIVNSPGDLIAPALCRNCDGAYSTRFISSSTTNDEGLSLRRTSEEVTTEASAIDGDLSTVPTIAKGINT